MAAKKPKIDALVQDTISALSSYALPSSSFSSSKRRHGHGNGLILGMTNADAHALHARALCLSLCCPVKLSPLVACQTSLE